MTGQKKFALAVQEVPAILLDLAKDLEGMGLTVVSATSINDARTRMRFQQFDVIVTDLNFSTGDVIPFLSEIHRTASGPKNPIPLFVVFSSQRPDAETEMKLTKFLGVACLLDKPWDRAKLAEFVGTRMFGTGKANPYNAKVLNVILNAVSAAIELNSKERPTPGKPVIRPRPVALGEFTASIHLTGAHVQGAAAITFERGLLRELAIAMSPELASLESDEFFSDFAGEMANQVAGQAQAMFLKEGLKFKISTPTVVRGVGHVIEFRYHAPCLVLPFTWRGQTFHAEFVMVTQENKEPEPEEKRDVISSGDISFF